MTDYLPCEELHPQTPATASVIWLHGLGADGRDFVPVIPMLRLPREPAIRFVFPHAPSIPVTANNGYVMPAWFDILAFDEERKFNPAQLLASAAQVHKLIDREIERGIPSDRIMLAGFSQGGAVNFQAALTYDKPLAGLLALSTYFPSHEAIDVHPANAGLPILLCHGSNDQILSVRMAMNSRRYLEQLGFTPDFRTYFMAHEVCGEQLEDISRFIQNHF
ncbi:MAG: carboxylesterase [Pseudomonadales bacterium]|nr:carboxylesterase [Pseudomonadales bacterium]